jgi:ABC-2 type transport system ATP-binding protein
MDEAEYCDELVLIYRGVIIAAGTPDELKHGHMQDAVIDVRCDRPQDAMDFLQTLEGVQETALFGHGLHVVARTEDTICARIEAALRVNGIEPQRVERIVPSLEDVFVSLVEAHDRDFAAVEPTR